MERNNRYERFQHVMQTIKEAQDYLAVRRFRFLEGRMFERRGTYDEFEVPI